jgi:hypothetical protein
MWEAVIPRIVVQGQPKQKMFLDLISKEKSWVWWGMPVILATVEA